MHDCVNTTTTCGLDEFINFRCVITDSHKWLCYRVERMRSCGFTKRNSAFRVRIYCIIHSPIIVQTDLDSYILEFYKNTSVSYTRKRGDEEKMSFSCAKRELAVYNFKCNQNILIKLFYQLRIN